MTTRDAFRKAVESKDLDAMVACLADDVVLHSPVTFKPFEGKDAVKVLFFALLQVFEDFRYIAEYQSDDSKVLKFEAMVASRIVEGIDIL
ncbi:MAG: nuclear transport factor 2 family protein, partial [Actinobacteria bacterium]|nr:nuclear transport factor 2 family protein [Actinomycetota bacterium]